MPIGGIPVAFFVEAQVAAGTIFPNVDVSFPQAVAETVNPPQTGEEMGIVGGGCQLGLEVFNEPFGGDFIVRGDPEALYGGGKHECDSWDDGAVIHGMVLRRGWTNDPVYKLTIMGGSYSFNDFMYLGWVGSSACHRPTPGPSQEGNCLVGRMNFSGE